VYILQYIGEINDSIHLSEIINGHIVSNMTVTFQKWSLNRRAFPFTNSSILSIFYTFTLQSNSSYRWFNTFWRITKYRHFNSL